MTGSASPSGSRLSTNRKRNRVEDRGTGQKRTRLWNSSGDSSADELSEMPSETIGLRGGAGRPRPHEPSRGKRRRLDVNARANAQASKRQKTAASDASPDAQPSSSQPVPKPPEPSPAAFAAGGASSTGSGDQPAASSAMQPQPVSTPAASDNPLPTTENQPASDAPQAQPASASASAANNALQPTTADPSASGNVDRDVSPSVSNPQLPRPAHGNTPSNLGQGGDDQRYVPGPDSSPVIDYSSSEDGGCPNPFQGRGRPWEDYGGEDDPPYVRGPESSPEIDYSASDDEEGDGNNKPLQKTGNTPPGPGQGAVNLLDLSDPLPGDGRNGGDDDFGSFVAQANPLGIAPSKRRTLFQKKEQSSGAGRKTPEVSPNSGHSGPMDIDTPSRPPRDHGSPHTPGNKGGDGAPDPGSRRGGTGGGRSGRSGRHGGHGGDRSHPFTTDQEILEGWARLEQLIAEFVRDILVDTLPPGMDRQTFPYAVLHELTPIWARQMSTSPQYAPFLFELSIWNLLNNKFFSMHSVNWAYETRYQKTGEFSGSGGLAAAINNLTQRWGTPPVETQLYPHDKHQNFYSWRKDTVDEVMETFTSHEESEEMGNERIFDILWTWMGYVKEQFMSGTAEAWDVLVRRTHRVVVAAEDLAVKMRRSPDGVWSPFIPLAGTDGTHEALRPHQRTDLALRPGQAAPEPDALVTLTVVPGLYKYEMHVNHGDGNMSQVTKTVKRRAKCFIGLEYIPQRA